MDFPRVAVISALLLLCVIPLGFSSNNPSSECQNTLRLAMEASGGDFIRNFESIMSCAFLLEQQRMTTTSNSRQARGNLPFEFPEKRCNFPCSTTFKDVFLVQIPACASYDIQCCLCIVGTTFKTIFPQGSSRLTAYYNQFQTQLNEFLPSFSASEL